MTRKKMPIPHTPNGIEEMVNEMVREIVHDKAPPHDRNGNGKPSETPAEEND